MKTEQTGDLFALTYTIACGLGNIQFKITSQNILYK
jgi:hypothetical protein